MLLGTNSILCLPDGHGESPVSLLLMLFVLKSNCYYCTTLVSSWLVGFVFAFHFSFICLFIYLFIGCIGS